MERIEVRRQDGDRYAIAIRGHTLVVDQAGTGDAGPTPTELWVSGLVSCVAFYAGSFLTRHGIDAEALTVTAEWAFAQDRPQRVGEIRISLVLPRGFPEELTERVRAVIERCTVHNSMTHPPDVSIELTAPAHVA